MEAHTRSTPGAGARLAAIRSSARYGRLRARLPRYGLLAAVFVLCAAGLHSIFLAPPSSPAPAPGPPVDFAEQNFAVSFARAYLTYSARHPEVREAELEPYASSGFEAGAGFKPPQGGSQRVLWAEVAQVQRPLVGGVIVTVAAKLSTAAEPVYLSIPVDRGGGGAIYLAAYPSFVGPPLSTARPTEQGFGEPVQEVEVEALVKRALANYMAGDAEDLSADLAGVATVTLPTNRLVLRAVDQLDWVSGNGGGAVLATVAATDPRGGEYTLRYEIGLRRVGSAEPALGPGWRVTYFQAISQQS
ncbi:MAG TPA: conjugal transfer protein [Solirubrobacterales bacterium]|nr:conjugal transfer protein [Solirubrobacterales bacterium]